MASSNPPQQQQQEPQPHPLTTTTTPSDRRTPITAAATAFLESYARAMHLASTHDPNPDNNNKVPNIPLVASALGAHYGPDCTAYTHTHRISLPTAAAWVPGIAAHLARFERCGLGCDVRLVARRVEPVAEGCALCWLTWRIWPRRGGGGGGAGGQGVELEEVEGEGEVVEGWEWENVYAYRRASVGAGVGAGAGGRQEGQGEEGEEKVMIGGGEGGEGAWVKPEGWWEFIVSDNEISSLLARVPDFMTR
ncbi:histidine ammonia-lyase [Diplodia corticola]|uniref:Histidine ammonia-lyase n=1 Tax=Diplodia corticola TaxID=236234 RepID=A0A1J9S1Z1_9PEZI|nr:histidine ammonia-lyase [Diplodia corticola]OJD34591.1 histidine ammonia-lyase [Diplodia corticola]